MANPNFTASVVATQILIAPWGPHRIIHSWEKHQPPTLCSRKDSKHQIGLLPWILRINIKRCLCRCMMVVIPIWRFWMKRCAMWVLQQQAVFIKRSKEPNKHKPNCYKHRHNPINHGCMSQCHVSGSTSWNTHLDWMCMIVWIYLSWYNTQRF